MTREELKEHCEKQIEMCEMWAIAKGEEPSGNVYEEHKLILELLEQEPCEDAISRQAVLDYQYTIDESETLGISTRNVVNVDDILNAKPVLPKYNTSEWCTNCREYDQDKHCCPRYNKVIRNTVEEMKQEPCEDCISRKDVLDALEQEEPLVWCDGADEIAAYDQWSSDVDTIKNMPSVQPQPKIGHWISYWDEEARCHVYKCPECGNKQPFNTKHCWECGSRLVEPQESEG